MHLNYVEKRSLQAAQKDPETSGRKIDGQEATYRVRRREEIERIEVYEYFEQPANPADSIP